MESCRVIRRSFFLWAFTSLFSILVSYSVAAQALLGKLTPLNGVGRNPGQTILFTANGGAGWIGDTSRDRVLVFDARTGTILRTINNVLSPGSMTLSPDRRTIAAVGVGTNTLTLIDTYNYSIRVLSSFQAAAFDIANNAVFSLDGSRLFIADFALSNLLSFDVASATLIRSTPLIANAKPGAIALTPDGQFVAAATTGLRSTIGNYIAILRADTLLPYRTGRLAVNNADFSTSNNIVFGANGAGYIAAYGSGRLFSFDPVDFSYFSTAVGSGPGAITLSSDGKWLAINNSTEATISFLELRSIRGFTSTTLARSPLNPLSRVQFSPNGKLAFMVSPATNELLIISTTDGTIRRRLALAGGPAQLLGNPERGLLYSLSTQDRTIGVSSFVLNFPILRQSANDFTGFALSNPTDASVTVAATGYDNNGQPLRALDGATARIITLPAQSQLARFGDDLLNSTNKLEGWVQLTSLDEITSGFFLQGNAAFTFLNGGVVTGNGSVRLGFTRILEGSRVFGDPAVTELHVVNPTLSSAFLTLNLYDVSGQLLGTVSRLLPPLNRINTPVSRLFTSTALPLNGGFIEVNSSIEIIGYETVKFGNSLFVMAGRDLSALPVGSLYSAQLASGFSGDQFFTDINLVNTSNDLVRATVRLVSDNGQLIEGAGVINPVSFEIAPKSAVSGRGSQLFGFPDEATDPNLFVGSIIVDMSGPGLLGDVIFGEPLTGRFISSLPMTYGLATDIVFSQVAEGSAGGQSYITGIAILNPNVYDAAITLRVFSAEGRLVGSFDFTLTAGGRVSKLLREFVPAALGQLGGYVRLTASGGVTAFELFATTTPAQFLASVPGQVIR
ncbi:MAG: hypothetical protein HYR55_15865 [Acidobacteria bacterium]|nr:hypothetical protein [Acidobacteriota bacterium]MBI3656804.1 hypothetical protein [Acidobacteriota bacterium]